MGSQLRPFSDPLMGFSQSIILLSLIVQPSRFRFILFIPVLLCNLYLITRTTTQNPGKDNIIGSVLATHLLTASDFILLTNPQKALKLWTEKEPIALNPVRAGSLFGRVKWGFQLFLNPRGIGWEHEPINSLRSKPTSSRWNFVASQVLWTCAYVLLYDLAGLYRHWAGTNIDLSRMTIQGERMSLPGAIFWRSMHLGMFGTISVTHMCISYTALSAVLVGVGVTEPRDWPHLFGYWSRAYTIRNFWG
ncbi:hypothetical protein AX16_002682 [Volvariella volvacea WC 439]|nr:hypothetical protein AX16_002682 [Volvariella volvacea WC 439]